jgi:hypothetical protein
MAWSSLPVAAMTPRDEVERERIALMAASRVVDLRDVAAQLTDALAVLRQRNPDELPSDAAERASELLILLLRTRDAFRRYVALTSGCMIDPV